MCDLAYTLFVKLHISCQFVRLSSFHIQVQISEFLSKSQMWPHSAPLPACYPELRCNEQRPPQKHLFSSLPKSFPLLCLSQTLRPSITHHVQIKIQVNVSWTCISFKSEKITYCPRGLFTSRKMGETIILCGGKECYKLGDSFIPAHYRLASHWPLNLWALVLCLWSTQPIKISHV